MLRPVVCGEKVIAAGVRGSHPICFSVMKSTTVKIVMT